MKTIELDLKKKVLIVDEKDFDYYEIFEEGIYFKLENGDREFIEGQFFIFGKGLELIEEIASELVDKSIYTGLYAHYVDKIPVNTYCYNSAIESFISGVESKKFYWLKNHIKHPKDYEVFPDSLSMYAEQEKLHLAAEEKTFRNPLIFVKK